jgi:hypothetical protein
MADVHCEPICFHAGVSEQAMTFAAHLKAAMLRALEKPIYARSGLQCGFSEWMWVQVEHAPWWWMRRAN